MRPPAATSRIRARLALTAAVGLSLGLTLPAVSRAAEAGGGASGTASVASPQSETATTTTPAQTTETAPTLTVEPAPTPKPATPPAAAPRHALPRVRAQRPQGSSGASPPGQRSKGKGSAGANGSGAQRNGPRAPSPSALTPPLPLAFSASLSGMPGFFIESFRIPPFLLPLYQAAGTAYGVPWQVLAAINEVETDYGRDLSVSSAGAEGWMQFLPSSWAIYGVDANGDGFKDPYNPADAIFAAARYLRAAGAATNLRSAIYAYNHSDAYVESVLLRARLLGGTPSELLGAITGLTQARFPVHAPSHFSDGFPQASQGSGAPRAIAGTTIYSQAGAPVIAVQDGQIVQIGRSGELGRFVALRDAFGNTYIYAQLGRVAPFYPVLRPHEGSSPGAPRTRSGEPVEPVPAAPASAGTQPRATASTLEGAAVAGLTPGSLPGAGTGAPQAGPAAALSSPPPVPPAATHAAEAAPAPAAGSGVPHVFRAGPNDVYLHPLRRGARVIAGTVLGHVAGAPPSSAGTGEGEPHMLFQIRPAGAGAPLIDPKPILDGWVALENSSIFHANGANPYPATGPTPGQVLLESKQQLEQQVLDNRAIQIYSCGRADISTGQIDRRVLATLEFLAVSGLRPDVSALKCGASTLTGEAGLARANGDSLEISSVNGVPIAGHQGAGSITDTTLRKLVALQGSMRPRQIVSLMRYPGASNTLARPDHSNRIYVEFQPPYTPGAHTAGVFAEGVTPDDWIKLIARLGEIPNPVVRSGPSPASIPDSQAVAGAGESNGNR